MNRDALRHHTHDQSPFGADRFGQAAERLARFFGTPKYIIGQTVIVILWILANTTLVHAGIAWDVYPFILLNLAFSTQAAYAAPLILLAQTRQADRDKAGAEADAKHRQEEADAQRQLLATVCDRMDERTPGGLQILDKKLDMLLNRRLGVEPVGKTTNGGDW